MSIDGRLELGTDISRVGAIPETDVAFAVAVAALILRVLRALRLDDDRCRRGEDLQGVAHANCDRAVIDRLAGGFVPQQSHIEGAPSRRRKLRAHFVENGLEEIG